MTILSILVSFIILIIFPCIVGAAMMQKLGNSGLKTSFPIGFLVSFATLEVLYVVFVFLDLKFSMLYNVIIITWSIELTVALYSIIKHRISFKSLFAIDIKHFNSQEIFFVAIIIIIFIYNAIRTISLGPSTGAGDDAQYMSYSTAVIYNNTLWPDINYYCTGNNQTHFSMKVALSCCNAYYAIIGKITNTSAPAVANTLLPLAMQMMVYLVLFCISSVLLDEREDRFLFVSLALAFMLFGYYSYICNGVNIIKNIDCGKSIALSVALPVLIMVNLQLTSKRFAFVNAVLVLAIAIAMIGMTLNSIFYLAIVALFSMIFAIIKYRNVHFIYYVLVEALPVASASLLYFFGS